MGSRNFLLTIDAIQLAKTTACSFSRGMDNHFKGATLDLEKKNSHRSRSLSPFGCSRQPQKPSLMRHNTHVDRKFFPFEISGHEGNEALLVLLRTVAPLVIYPSCR
jgi:hypothetical protein